MSDPLEHTPREMRFQAYLRRFSRATRIIGILAVVGSIFTLFVALDMRSESDRIGFSLCAMATLLFGVLVWATGVFHGAVSSALPVLASIASPANHGQNRGRRSTRIIARYGSESVSDGDREGDSRIRASRATASQAAQGRAAATGEGAVSELWWADPSRGIALRSLHEAHQAEAGFLISRACSGRCSHLDSSASISGGSPRRA
jgi:hypothetical protein